MSQVWLCCVDGYTGEILDCPAVYRVMSENYESMLFCKIGGWGERRMAAAGWFRRRRNMCTWPFPYLMRLLSLAFKGQPTGSEALSTHAKNFESCFTLELMDRVTPPTVPRHPHFVGGMCHSM